MATSQTKRVLELIKRFNEGQKICIENLQRDPAWWNDVRNEPMSEKSIRRDIDVIREYFDLEVQKAKIAIDQSQLQQRTVEKEIYQKIETAYQNVLATNNSQ